jgi:divalent metal cation (Fe/Co/Zn/Cd) transporter
MDLTHLIPEFLVFSLAGSSLSIAAYSAFRDKNDDKKLLLVIAGSFTSAFLVLFTLTFLTLENLTPVEYFFALVSYFMIFTAVMGIMGFVIRRLIVDQRSKDDELESAIDIIDSSKDGLDSFINLLESKKPPN